jgi:hypothetical protein
LGNLPFAPIDQSMPDPPAAALRFPFNVTAPGPRPERQRGRSSPHAFTAGHRSSPASS